MINVKCSSVNVSTTLYITVHLLYIPRLRTHQTVIYYKTINKPGTKAIWRYSYFKKNHYFIYYNTVKCMTWSPVILQCNFKIHIR